jgi:erythromycin esterase-like protein
VEVLHNFNRWPTWMWANWEVVALVEWVRRYNEDRLHTTPDLSKPPDTYPWGV